MKCYEQRVSFLEFLYRKPGVNLTELAEAPEILKDVILDVFDDLERSKGQLREHISALEARNRELEAYAHMVAHNLKDPLSVMVATSGLISQIPDLTRDEMNEYLTQIRSSAYKMNRIINNLLLFAEVTRADAPLEHVDMARVVANVQDRLICTIKDLNAHIDIPESWPDCLGYGPWIEEVWVNYLSNALKHGGRPPRVELGASSEPDGKVLFWTRDNGPGLPTDIQANLFTPFSQIGRSCNVGHGLGLSITHYIVEKLGGQVGVESELGKGSLFFFSLPTGNLPERQASVDSMKEISFPA